MISNLHNSYDCISLQSAINYFRTNITKMKLFGIILSFLFLSNFAFSVGLDQDGPINQKDAKGKQGKWIYFGKDRPELGIPATGKVEEGKFVDDRKEGVWIKYHNDGVTPKLKGNFENGRPKGPYTKYHQNGKIKEIGTFERNTQLDSLVRYHDNGKVEYEAVYNSTGKEQGKVKYYYSNGQVEYEYTANNGNPTGKAIRYYENGDIKEITYYDESGNPTKTENREPVRPLKESKDINTNEKAPSPGANPDTKGQPFKPNGYNKIYVNGEITQDGIFKDGRLWDGKIYVYDRDNILLKVKVYKDGLHHSDGQL